MRIKVINPNTTESMTRTIGDAATRVASPGTEIVAVIPSMGPVSIESHCDEAISVVGVSAAVKLVETLVSLKLGTSKLGDLDYPPAKPYTGAMEAFAPVLPQSGFNAMSGGG